MEFPHDSYPAYFTLKHFPKTKNGVTYHSMYQKYMEIADPTEYQVAIQLLGSWDHWVALQRGKWFQEELVGWRDELKIKLESQRYYEMVGNLKDPKAKVQATKWLASRYGDSDKQTKKRGRPSRIEKENHLRRLSEASEDTKEDAKRLGL